LVFYLLRESFMMSIDPVDDTSIVDAEMPPYCSEAHPFQVQLHCLLSEGSLIPIGLGVRCEIPLAGFAPHALTASSVVA
jgi:hypothetical protein